MRQNQRGQQRRRENQGDESTKWGTGVQLDRLCKLYQNLGLHVGTVNRSPKYRYVIFSGVLFYWACGQHSNARILATHSPQQAPGGRARHRVLNDLVARAFVSAGFSDSEEPAGLSRADGKRPDGTTLIPWQAGKPVVWDVTVICMTVDSNVEASARGYDRSLSRNFINTQKVIRSTDTVHLKPNSHHIDLSDITQGRAIVCSKIK